MFHNNNGRSREVYCWTYPEEDITGGVEASREHPTLERLPIAQDPTGKPGYSGRHVLVIDPGLQGVQNYEVDLFFRGAPDLLEEK